MRKEHIAGLGRPDISDLERAGMIPEAVVPIVVENSVVAVLALAGATTSLEKERRYVSMLADLIGNACRTGMALESLEQRAMTDPLTGLHNRAYLTERFAIEFRRAKNYRLPLSVILFDLDRFKSVNDVHGHPAGDAVLRQFAEILRESTRSSDVVARYGGEEFAILLGNFGSDQAYLHADRLRAALEAKPLVLPNRAEPLRMTVSGGVATYPDNGGSFEELFRQADTALYEAKQTGRNRICRPKPPESLGQPQ
jgi:diguanylate cyclase (GGDEF)-like protein